MNAMLDEVARHWVHLAPLLTEPVDEADYDAKVEALDELLDTVGDDEEHPLASLAARLGDVIEAYDEESRSMPEASGAEVLRYLMTEHGISQSELPEVGAQSVVSAILSGKRSLNWRQICGISDRFGVPTDAFKEHRM
ncbi:helix-turn-helix domain-containing protein [Onishia taeanensis]